MACRTNVLETVQNCAMTSSDAAPNRELIACKDCDLLQYRPAGLQGHVVLRCSGCGGVLHESSRHGLERTLALALGALVLFLVSNVFPIVGLELNDNRTEVELYGAVTALFNQGEHFIAGIVTLTTMVVPAIEVLALVYMLLPLYLGRVPRFIAPVFRIVHACKPWGMVEVFMLGVLVSVVKLANFASVLPGVALWSFGALILLMAAAALSFNPSDLWARVDALEQRYRPVLKPLAGLGGRRPTAWRLGLIACDACGQVHRQPAGMVGNLRCARCGATLIARKRDSVRRTWAFLITAVLFYIPANVLPVMETDSLFGAEHDTIMSGIHTLWVTGSWPLAVIVFFASIMVPLLKLLMILFLLWGIHTGSQWRPARRSVLYRFVEGIGRWSMLDIYVVTLLATLVQLRGLASIQIGPGATAFAVVVVMTMFAAQSLDPRLIWDPIENEDE